MDTQNATASSVVPDATTEKATALPTASGEECPNSSALSPEQIEQLPPELRPGPDGKPPEITEKTLRKLRARYFTVRHPLLNDCGHRLDMINQPKNNCENCWYQFFNTHPQLVETADQFFRTHGKKAMAEMRGDKFVRMFVRFMATVIHFMKEEGRLPDGNNQSGTNTDSVNGSQQEGEAGGVKAVEQVGKAGGVVGSGEVTQQ